MSHVVIIGNGIAGITAARHIRKFSDKKITVISAETEYFFSRTALMYVFMGHMKLEHTQPYENWFWEKNRIELKQAYIDEVDFKNKALFSVEGEEITYDQLILATGSVTNFREWKGQEVKGVQGLVSKQDLELLEENSANLKHAVIVGGGLIGVELAEMLHLTFWSNLGKCWCGIFSLVDFIFQQKKEEETHRSLYRDLCSIDVICVFG